MDLNRLLFHVKYPKIYLLIAMIAIATIIYANSGVYGFITALGEAAYLGSFISGMLFSLGILAPFGAGYWSVVLPKNIFVAAILGGLGSMIIDVMLLRFIKSALHARIKKAKGHKLMPKINKALKHRLGKALIPSISFAVAGLLIAAPLPKNLGTVLVLGITKVREREVAIISFVIYTIIALFFLSLKILLPLAATLFGLA